MDSIAYFDRKCKQKILSAGQKGESGTNVCNGVAAIPIASFERMCYIKNERILLLERTTRKTTKTITVTVIKNEEPVINATDKEIPVNSEFDEMLSVTASDKEDGNLTKNIKVIKNTVNTKELGTYEVTYQVTDSFNQTVTKTIIIKVTEVKRTKNNGRFDLSYLKVIDGKISIKGYSTIDGIDNNLNTKIDYKLIMCFSQASRIHT